MAETTYKKGELLFNESVVTSLAYNFAVGTCQTQMFLNQEVLIIDFNGIEYECEANNYKSQYIYGGFNSTTTTPDFSIYPFVINNMVSGSSPEDVVITDTINLLTENPGTYSLKVYTAIPDSDSSSESVTIRSYIDRNLPNLNWNILPQIFESEGVELAEEIKRYLRETPKNTNWNVFKQMTSSEEISLTVVFDEDVSFSREAYAPQAECTIQHGILSETPDVLYVQMGEENFMLPKCGDNLYGEMNNDTIVFTTYPLYIYSNDNYTYMATPTVKTVHIKISIAN